MAAAAKKVGRKTRPCSLQEVVETATAEEKAEAQKVIKGLTEKQKKSKLACMMHFARDQVEVTLSRGEVRERYHEAYHVHMLRIEKSQKTFSLDKSMETSKKKFETFTFGAARRCS